MTKIINIEDFLIKKSNDDWLKNEMLRSKEDLIDDNLGLCGDLEYFESMFRYYFNNEMSLDEQEEMGLGRTLEDFCKGLMLKEDE